MLLAKPCARVYQAGASRGDERHRIGPPYYADPPYDSQHDGFR
jgi:hypothetical protein